MTVQALLDAGACLDAPSTLPTPHVSTDALQFAVRADAPDCVRMLLRAGAALTESVLRTICAHNRLHCFRVLFEEGISCPPELLHLACEEDGDEIIRDAAQRGAPIDTAIEWREVLDPNRGTLDTALRRTRTRLTPLMLAAGRGALGCVRALLDCGASLLEEEGGWTAICFAAANNRTLTLRRLLDGVRETSPVGTRSVLLDALAVASSRGATQAQLQILRIFTPEGAATAATAVLPYAVRARHGLAIRVLVDHGADVDAHASTAEPATCDCARLWEAVRQVRSYHEVRDGVHVAGHGSDVLCAVARAVTLARNGKELYVHIPHCSMRQRMLLKGVEVMLSRPHIPASVRNVARTILGMALEVCSDTIHGGCTTPSTLFAVTRAALLVAAETDIPTRPLRLDDAVGRFPPAELEFARWLPCHELDPGVAATTTTEPLPDQRCPPPLLGAWLSRGASSVRVCLRGIHRVARILSTIFEWVDEMRAVAPENMARARIIVTLASHPLYERLPVLHRLELAIQVLVSCSTTRVSRVHALALLLLAATWPAWAEATSRALWVGVRDSFLRTVASVLADHIAPLPEEFTAGDDAPASNAQLFDAAALVLRAQATVRPGRAETILHPFFVHARYRTVALLARLDVACLPTGVQRAASAFGRAKYMVLLDVLFRATRRDELLDDDPVTEEAHSTLLVMLRAACEMVWHRFGLAPAPLRVPHCSWRAVRQKVLCLSARAKSVDEAASASSAVHDGAQQLRTADIVDASHTVSEEEREKAILRKRRAEEQRKLRARLPEARPVYVDGQRTPRRREPRAPTMQEQVQAAQWREAAKERTEAGEYRKAELHRLRVERLEEERRRHARARERELGMRQAVAEQREPSSGMLLRDFVTMG